MNQRLLSACFVLWALAAAVNAAQNPVSVDLSATPLVSRQVGRANTDASFPAPRSNAELRSDPAFADIEKSYLEGKVTARQFQKLIQDLRTALPKVVAPTNPPPVQTVKAPVVLTPRPPAAPPLVVAPAAVPATAPLRKADLDDGSGFSDIEGRVNELLQKKAERERAAETKLTPAELLSPATPLTKRQRLDLLLRLFVQEKITQADYQATRAKIMDLPDEAPR